MGGGAVGTAWRRATGAGAGDVALAMALGLLGLPTLSFMSAQLLLLAGGRLDLVSGRILLTLAAGASIWMVRAAGGGRFFGPLAVFAAAVGFCALSGLVIDTSYDGL